MADSHRTPPQGTTEQFGADRPVSITADVDKDPNRVTPNTGSSVPDLEDQGDKSQSLASWQKSVGIDPAAQIKLVKLSHMRYQHPDLAAIKTFLQDFGMHVVQSDTNRLWFRGYGPDPYVYYAQSGPEKAFLGGTFIVSSAEDLEKASRLPGASPIQDLSDAPGGGRMVTVKDPQGFPMNLLYGQEPAPTGEYPEKIIVNDEVDKPRVRKFNRFTPGPAAVHKLGHYGYMTENFAAMVEFYTRNFNFAPTDFLFAPTGEGEGHREVGVFMHLDRGDEPVDHHTLFMAENPTTHVHHSSFEVHDLDTQMLGHQHLASKGYTLVWGPGRHILGSQLFDYVTDTSGNMIEHYADGDMVTQETPIGWTAAGDEALAVWGPESEWMSL